MHWITVENERREQENVFLIISVWDNQIFDVLSREAKLVSYNFLWNFASSITFYYNLVGFFFYSILMKQM